MKKREAKDNSVEKRSLMYSQIFNYENISRDPFQRHIEVTAAVESGGKSITNKKNYYIGLLVVAVVIALCFVWSGIRGDVAEFINNFLLEQNGVEMQLTEPQPLEMDVNAFVKKASESRDYYTGEPQAYYYRSYNNWSEVPLSDGTRDHVAEESALKFTHYTLMIYQGDKSGKLEISVRDDDAGKFDEKMYEVYGYFKIADYTKEGTVLADKGDLATFVYETENGNKAYFIRNWTYGTYTVYFVVDDIMFEMEIDNSKKAVENAKVIFEAMEE